MSPASYEFMKTVGTTIRSAGFRTALVMPPFTQDIAHMGVTSKQIGDISVGYSYVVVMTYDFSMPSSESPGPLAPLPWVQMAARYFTDICGLREKVLLGLNFYGIDFALGDKTRASNRHIVAHEFVNLLQTQDVQVNWHEAYKEHYFIYEQHSQQENAESEEEGTKQGEKTHVMFYPTRSSIRERVNLARDTNCGGIAIWDIGQGLNHFFEEF